MIIQERNPNDSYPSLYDQGIISRNRMEFTPTHEGPNDGNPVYVPDSKLEAVDPEQEFQNAVSGGEYGQAAEIFVRNRPRWSIERHHNDARKVINGDIW